MTEKDTRNEYDDARREFAAASEALDIAKAAYWRAERRMRNAQMAHAREYADCFRQPVRDQCESTRCDYDPLSREYENEIIK